MHGTPQGPLGWFDRNTRRPTVRSLGTTGLQSTLVPPDRQPWSQSRSTRGSVVTAQQGRTPAPRVRRVGDIQGVRGDTGSRVSGTGFRRPPPPRTGLGGGVSADPTRVPTTKCGLRLSTLRRLEQNPQRRCPTSLPGSKSRDSCYRRKRSCTPPVGDGTCDRGGPWTNRDLIPQCPQGSRLPEQTLDLSRGHKTISTEHQWFSHRSPSP